MNTDSSVIMPRQPTHQFDFTNYPLGGRIPQDKKHLEKFPLRAGIDFKAATLPERPNYTIWPIGIRYDQGSEGACVGFGWSAWVSAYIKKHKWDTHLRIDAFEVYENAKKLDPWPGEDYEGTATGAGGEALRVDGGLVVADSKRFFIDEYRWATDVQDILNTLAFNGPVVLGTDWYTNFDSPQKHAFAGGKRLNFFIGEGDLGTVRGGHCIIAQGYYRNRYGDEWIRLQNSWGWDYPLVWLPVSTVQTLWDAGSLEAGVVTQVRL